MIKILRFVQTSAQNIGGWELRLGTLFPGAQYSTSTAVHCWSSSNPPLDQDVKTLPEMGNSLRLPQPPSPPLPSQVPCVPDCGQRTAQLLHLQMTEQNGATGDVEDISQKMEKFPLIPDGSVK